MSAGDNVLRVVNKKAAATGLERCTQWMEKVTIRLEGCGERDEERARMVERDLDHEALEKEERIAEAEEWRNQKASWRLRQEVTEEETLLDSCQGDVISQQKDPEVGRVKIKRR